MRKAILYILFVGLLVFTGSPAHAFALGHHAMEGVASEVAQQNPDAETVTESGSKLHKGDLLGDFDDYDECDCEEHETSVREKGFSTPLPYLINAQSTIHFLAVPFCNRSYHHLNFSRLPRYNFISLCVLRL